MERVYIIAEAGVNHNGSLKLAMELAAAAKAAGADAVKYQTFRAEKLASAAAAQAAYQKENMGDTGSQLDMLKKLQLSHEDFRRLKAYCDDIGITFLSTAFDEESLDFLMELDMPVLKIPSGEIANLPLLTRMAQTGKPLIMSTGMCDMAEVAAAVELLKNNGGGDICLLHCTTEYPAPVDGVNLRAMVTMADTFHLPVGYSDHTEGIEVPVAAVALGARVIEKHFTLDKSMEGPDHKASLLPAELTAMVAAVRQVERALGGGQKVPTPVERQNRTAARKSIVAACPICRGEVFTERNLTTKRPGNGLSPMLWHQVLGQTADRDYDTDDLIVGK